MKLRRQETDTERFERLVWPWMTDVVRVARVLTGSEAEGDDLAQETMLRAYRGLQGFAEGTNVRAWLMTILRNARVDRVRSEQKRAGEVSLEGLDVDVAGPGGSAEGHAWGDVGAVMQQFGDADILKALQGIPEEIRWTLLLVDVEGMDLAEAAGVLGVALGTVKSRTHRGRAMLRERLLPLAKERGWVRGEG